MNDVTKLLLAGTVGYLLVQIMAVLVACAGGVIWGTLEAGFLAAMAQLVGICAGVLSATFISLH